jgi:hypothetical protein
MRTYRKGLVQTLVQTEDQLKFSYRSIIEVCNLSMDWCYNYVNTGC